MSELSRCPLDPNRDDRKSAQLVAQNLRIDPGIERVGSFAFAREMLRNASFKQDGAGAEQVDVGNPEHVPVFYLDGELHHARRAAIVKFFMPKAINTRLRAVMEKTSETLMKALQAKGSAKLDQISFELAAAVASEIVGLSDSDQHEMSLRLLRLLDAQFRTRKGVLALFNKALTGLYFAQFFLFDVLPAVRSRKKQRREDVISQVLDKGYSMKAIIIECMTYAMAGMVTTREFIVMAAWHMFDRPELRERFVSSDEDGQLQILQEILRLDPVAAMVWRRADEEVETSTRGKVPAKSKFAIDLRAVHADEALVGACPYALDPDRAKKVNQNGTYMSFGDGPHRCPGWQVALAESRVFLDQLMRVPGIRLERAPDMSWSAIVSGYELRNAVVACDRTPS